MNTQIKEMRAIIGILYMAFQEGTVSAGSMVLFCLINTNKSALSGRKTMSYIDHTDNIYAVGTFITAKSAPDLKLKVVKYFNRIYYCAVVSDSDAKPLAYFERELIAPL